MERYKSAHVHWHGLDRIIVYDLLERTIAEEITDYSLHLSGREQLSMLTVSQEIGYVRFFAEFLNARGIAITRVDNIALRGFRDHAFEGARRSKSFRGHEDTAKATSNAKLRRAYLWLQWLQDRGRLYPASVGPVGCSVTCTLNPRNTPAKAYSVGTTAISSRELYPLEFRLRTSKSKHRTPPFVPTDLTLDDLHEHFFSSTPDEYLAHRNCLIVDLANFTGLRRASLNSLRVRQFEEAPLVRGSQEALIRPDSQKFSYINSFAFPAWLVENVLAFSRTHRRELLRAKGVGNATHKDRLFLSARDGRPLTDRAISALVSDALRGLGAPKGTSIHSFRHKFADESIQQDIEHRVANGLDTSSASIAASAAMRLGHRDPKSLIAYVSAAQSKRAAMVRSDRQQTIRAYQEQVASLREEIASLKARLGQS